MSPLVPSGRQIHGKITGSSQKVKYMPFYEKTIFVSENQLLYKCYIFFIKTQVYSANHTQIEHFCLPDSS